MIYRFGEALTYEDLESHHVGEEFEPFTPEAEAAHRGPFQALVDQVMARIDELVDEAYKFSEDGSSEGVEGSRRFV